MSDDLRDRLARFLDDQADDSLQDLVEAVFSATKDDWVTIACKDCGKHQRVPVPVPDVVARAKALDLLTNQAKGKPAQTVRHQHEGTIGLRPVDALSISEIEAELAAVRARRALPSAPTGAS